jgi:transposase
MTKETVETIWRTPDELWAQIEPVIMAKDPPKRKGRKRVSARLVLDTLLHRLRSGCQWNHLPGELADDSSAHRSAGAKWGSLMPSGRYWSSRVLT